MISGFLDEVSDKATALLRSGQARTPEEAADLAFRICCSGGHCPEPGLGGFFSDVWDTLVGKPQSWYTNVSNIQNRLIVLLAGVTAVGQDAWNNTTDGTTDYGQVTSDIQAAITSIIVTSSHVPEDSTIAAAQDVANRYQKELDLVQSATPSVADQVQADQAQVEAMLPAAMTSPSAVGRQVFEDELSKRANALVSGFSIGTGLALGAGGLFLLWYFFGRG